MAPPKLTDCVADRALYEGDLDFVNVELIGHPHVPLPEAAIDQHLEMVLRTKTGLTETHRKIIGLAPADLADHQKEYFRLLKIATTLHCQLHGIKITFIPAPTPPPHGSTKQDFKLPRIDLPSFDGSIIHWVSFRDMFVTAVDSNTSLSKAQKLTYLKSRLTGEALRQINSIIITDANYDVAWTLLNNRYHSERELFSSTLQRFLSQSSKPEASSSYIRSIVDGAKECISALEKLSLPSNPTSEAIIMFHMTIRLDFKSKELWEQSRPDSKLPQLKELYDFLESRARSLASTESSSSSSKPSTRPPQRDEHPKRQAHAHHVSEGSSKCKVCKISPHSIYKCTTFMEKSPKEKGELVKKLGLCFNCLHHGHALSKCTSQSRCRTCNGKHHTLIHLESNRHQNQEIATSSASEVPAGNSNPSLNFHASDVSSDKAILATAIIRVLDGNGEYQLCRAFLDAGSTASFITTACANRLNLSRRKSNVEVIGLSSAHLGHANGITSVIFKPHFKSSASFTVESLILPRVTGKLPLDNCDPRQWSHLNNLCYADPEFGTPAPVDILQQGPPNTPVAVNTQLGWLVGGKTGSVRTKVHVHHADVNLDAALRRFWELESTPIQPTLNEEERAAEEHFLSSVSRDPSGRFTVKIPWKKNSPILGDSRSTAIRRFKQLERRLPNTPQYHADYKEFMNEYLSLCHMELVPDEEVSSPHHPTYYIPHHFVLKEESTSTKFRVVFDASAKTSTGVSLNQQMLVGTTLQDNITDIVMRFRCHSIAFTADISKMYRQILLAKEDQDRHRIFWRNSPEDELKEYRLLTVTYGTASAPFLATRVLQQLSCEEKNNLPHAYKAAMRDFYVDDLMGGADSLDEAINIKDELLELMRRGSLELRKWASNSTKFLLSLPEKLRETKQSCLTPTTTSPPTEERRRNQPSGQDSITTLQVRKDGIGESEESECIPLTTFSGADFSVKCLGIYWNTSKDVFQFRVNLPLSCPKITKRTVLSEMSKLYDPLGWLAPVVISAKIFMQSLWKLDIGWDDQLSEDYKDHWTLYKRLLKDLELIQIPRCIRQPNPSKLMLAGFSDASERAYAAVIFLCAYYDEQLPIISLVCSKTRVAPAKQVSLPRLELCGAVLLSQLLVNVKSALELQIDYTKAWTDSTVVLAWIRSISSSLKTFVGNRVSEIQDNLPKEHWYHIPGNINPADCASRGITPEELTNHNLWWNGPNFLTQELSSESTQLPLSEDDLQLIIKEQKREVLVAAATTSPRGFLDDLINRISCFNKLIRVVAYVRRFIHLRFFPTTISTGALSSLELNQSLLTLVRHVQRCGFNEEYSHLNSGKPLSPKSKILCLSPFLDIHGIIRVGGRLRHSSVPIQRRHPILLPRHHRLLDLLIQWKHLQHFHAGPQLLQSLLFQQFWILRARDAIRFSIKRCITCRKHSAKTMQTLMGDLPAARVNPGRPFLTCGVDYAGPLILKSDAPRSKMKIKAYLCIFVCFVTRAIHLEVVSSLSTDAFISALRRFVSRRNKPATIYSDCGTNFVGAARELKELTKFLISQDHNNQLTTDLGNQGIDWKFNPPGAPHFGGLWEAGVKSVKHHLHRVVGTTTLNFEEMTTLMTQIEACLNSRPLTPVSTSPDDFEALTPGHFLTGAPLSAVPQEDVMQLNIGRLDRWQLMQRKTQEFWNRWSAEYVSRLQQRPKWLQQRDQIALNDLVIIKDERLPPLKWKLGRVITMHPGHDNNTRVVTLKTSDGVLKRPLAKLCLLLHNEEPE